MRRIDTTGPWSSAPLGSVTDHNSSYLFSQLVADERRSVGQGARQRSTRAERHGVTSLSSPSVPLLIRGGHRAVHG